MKVGRIFRSTFLYVMKPIDTCRTIEKISVIVQNDVADLYNGFLETYVLADRFLCTLYPIIVICNRTQMHANRSNTYLSLLYISPKDANFMRRKP